MRTSIPIIFTSFFLLLFLCGCQTNLLNVQTQYLTSESRASFYVNTPDPAKNNPDIGERLMIHWSIPSDFLCCQELTLRLKVRFKDLHEEERTLAITEESGTYLFYVVNEIFCKTGGIATYRVDIIGDECLLETWMHPLWTDLITFPLQNKE